MYAIFAQYECEDIARDAFLCEAVGVGLGRAEMYNVMLAAKALGEDPHKGVATVRFFGKLLGIYADYYVFETVLKMQPEEDEAATGVHRAGLSGPSLAQSNRQCCASSCCSIVRLQKVALCAGMDSSVRWSP